MAQLRAVALRGILAYWHIRQGYTGHFSRHLPERLPRILVRIMERTRVLRAINAVQGAVQGRGNARMVALLLAVLLVLPGCLPRVEQHPLEEAPANATASIDPIPLINERPCLVIKAEEALGVREQWENGGPEVDVFLKSVGLGTGYYWCAAFVHERFRQCGKVLEPAREFAAAARFAREHIVFRHADLKDYGLDPLERISVDGDVFTLYYASLGRPGHVGIIVDETEDFIITIEGNTSDGGSRNGNGVYKRKRLKSSVHTVNRWRLCLPRAVEQMVRSPGS